MSDPQFYEVVLDPTGTVIESDLTLDDAVARTREWNRRNAVGDKWATLKTVRPPKRPEHSPATSDEADADDADDAKASFLPTLDQIREACLAIQETWSPAERGRRMAYGWEGGRQ